MRSAADILREFGIEARSTASGRFYALCPKCSAQRKPGNRKKQCLGVTIGAQGVKFGCNNCHWHGGLFYDDKSKGERVAGKSSDRPRAGGTYGSLQRSARGQWRPGA